jgi:hypothetical protein
MQVINLHANPRNPRVLTELVFRLTLADAERLAAAPLALIKGQKQLTREGGAAYYRGAGIWRFQAYAYDGADTLAVFNRAVTEISRSTI